MELSSQEGLTVGSGVMNAAKGRENPGGILWQREGRIG